MNRRGLIILTGLAVLMAGWITLDIYLAKRKETKKKETHKVLNLDWEKVHSITIQSDKLSEAIVIERRGHGESATWKLVQPVQDAVDKDNIDRLWSTLKDLTFDDSFSQGKSSRLADYGLDPPRGVLSLKDASGHTLGELRIGAKSSVAGQLYISTPGAGRIMLIEGYRESTLLPSLKDVRNRHLTNFKSSDITRLVVERFHEGSPTTLEVKKVQGLWRAVQPKEFLADSGALFSLTSSIEFLEAQDFIQENATDFEMYGLATPKARLTVENDKGQVQSFEFGTNRGEQEVYARVAGHKRVVTVSQSFVNDLLKEPRDWMAKNAVDFDYYNVSQATFASEGKEWKLLKQEAEGEGSEDTWKIINDKSARSIDNIVVEDVLRALDYVDGTLVTDQASSSNLGEYNLTKPWLVCNLKEKDKDKQILYIGTDGKKAYTFNPEFPGIIYQIPDQDWNEIREAWEKLVKTLKGEDKTKKGSNPQS